MVSAAEGWVFHNRLTHSIKVAQVARRIAEHLEKETAPEQLKAVGGLDVDVAEAASLAHDLGHPPFGHIAEETLQELTGEGHFEGNAQSFRIVTKLEPHGEDYRGLDLTRATLNAILKYPRKRHSSGNRSERKYGYYYESEKDEFEFARGGMGDPHKSLEAEIMDLADDITFAVHDTEDFYRAGMIPLHDLGPSAPGEEKPRELLRLIDDIRSRWGRQQRLPSEPQWQEQVAALEDVLFLLGINSPFHGTQNQLVHMWRATSGLISDYVLHGIRINATYQPGDRRVLLDQAIEKQLTMLKELVWTYVIDRSSLATQQVGHSAIVRALFEHFHDGIEKGDLRTLPARFHGIVRNRDQDVESTSRLAADIVCSLTDRQALVLFRRISGLDPGAMVPFTI